MPSSGIIDLAIGLTFVFGVAAALSSMVTELISRFLGLRGSYLLSGLRALVDDGKLDTELSQAGADYADVKKMMADPAASPTNPENPPSATGALLGGPILSSQGDAVRGVQEEFQFRNLSGDPDKGLQVDGIFGPKTDAAVRGFQQALHQDIPTVAVDGIVGPVTWRALVSGMLSG